MSSFKLPATDGDLVIALKTFSTAMETYATELGYSVGDEAATQAAYQEFDSKNTAAAVAKDAARGAVAAKTVAKRSSIETVCAYAQQIKNNPAATPAILSAFGITVEPKTAGPVQTPSLLSASPRIDGSCRLTWKPNGNAPATTYVIDESSDGANWTFLATVTATKFVDLNAQVGVNNWYRVRAARAGQISPWSNLATIYSGSSSTTLRAA